MTSGHQKEKEISHLCSHAPVDFFNVMTKLNKDLPYISTSLFSFVLRGLTLVLWCECL